MQSRNSNLVQSEGARTAPATVALIAYKKDRYVAAADLFEQLIYCVHARLCTRVSVVDNMQQQVGLAGFFKG